MTLTLKVLAAMLTVYALTVALLYVRQDSVQYQPDTRAYTQADVHVKDFEDFPVTAFDGLPLKGWYAPGDKDKPTLVVFHGNASTYQWRAPDFEKINAYGYGVLLVGYRGYGGNPGVPSEDAFYKDAETYLAALEKTKNIPRIRMVLYGESLGTGIAIEAATKKQVQALILENPFTSMPALAAHHYPFVPFITKLTRAQYDNLTRIAALKNIPKYFLIAEQDTIVPPAFGMKLFEAAPGGKKLKLYPDANHVDVRAQGGLEDIRAYLSIFNK